MGPVFREPWEAQAFAMALTLHQRGLFTWSEWAAALADEIERAQASGDPDTRRHLLSPLARHSGEIGRCKGRRHPRDPASLPRRLGPRRRPHSAWFADRIATGGFSVRLVMCWQLTRRRISRPQSRGRCAKLPNQVTMTRPEPQLSLADRWKSAMSVGLTGMARLLRHTGRETPARARCT